MVANMRDSDVSANLINSYTRAMKSFLAWCSAEGRTEADIRRCKAEEAVKVDLYRRRAETAAEEA